MSESKPVYGEGDASYQAAGGLEGLIRLADDFYEEMQALPEARRILQMHPPDLALSSKKLAYFLSGWLNGPRIYAEHFGPIRIPMAHVHLDVGEAERDAWLLCMQRAIARQPYAEDFKRYLLEQLAFPAERVRMVCAARRAAETR